MITDLSGSLPSVVVLLHFLSMKVSNFLIHGSTGLIKSLITIDPQDLKIPISLSVYCSVAP